MDDLRRETAALLRDPASHPRPEALYARLAGQAPVLDVGPLWVVSGHDELTAVAAHPGTRVDPAHVGLARPDEGRLTRLTAAMLPLRDGADHTRLKRLALTAFSHRQVGLRAERVEELTVAAVDAALASGSCDLVRDVAVPLPVTLTCELLDVPVEDRPLLQHWAELLVAALAPGARADQEPERAAHPDADDGYDRLAEYVARLCATRRRTPGADLISRLVAVHDDGGLDAEELLAFVVLLLTNGVETLTAGLSGVAWQVLQHPPALDAVRADATAATAVAEEALRLASPVRGSGRCTVTPVLDRDGGQLLPAGAVAILLYAAANRDPRRFADPHELLPGRAVASHLAFGTGPHRCLGAPLAMLACTAMLRRLAELGPLHTPLTPEAARWGEQFAFGGLVSLPLHVATPAAVAR